MDMESILKKIETQVDDAEIFTEKLTSTDVDILNDTVNHTKEEEIYGIGVRIIKDKRQGFAYTTNKSRIDETIKQAIRNSKINDKDENLVMIEGGQKYSKVDGLYDKKLIDVDLESAIEFSEDLIKQTIENGCNPTSGGYGASVSEIKLLNSNGVDIEEIQTGCGASVSVNVEDGDVMSSAYYYDLSHEDNLDLYKISQKACDLALKSRSAKPTQTRNTKVVLNHTAAVSLMSTFLSALNSENTQRGRSLLADKIGEQIATESLTLTDDGTIQGAMDSSIFDAEGTPSMKTTLIKDGILESFIFDAYYAKKQGEDTKTTSNAVRDGYASVPCVGFTNLKLDFKDESSIYEIQDGIMVDSVMGAHTANPITGDFSVEVMNGFEIQNGEITTPIKKAMISGNIFQIMKDACALEGEIRQIGSCITPRILADNLRVIG